MSLCCYTLKPYFNMTSMKVPFKRMLCMRIIRVSFQWVLCKSYPSFPTLIMRKLYKRLHILNKDCATA
jgi:hypothetical protein